MERGGGGVKGGGGGGGVKGGGGGCKGWWWGGGWYSPYVEPAGPYVASLPSRTVMMTQHITRSWPTCYHTANPSYAPNLFLCCFIQCCGSGSAWIRY